MKTMKEEKKKEWEEYREKRIRGRQYKFMKIHRQGTKKQWKKEKAEN